MKSAPLAAGFCFGEGPRWFEGLLWFSDMLGEAVHTVDLGGSMTTLPLPGRSPSGLGFRPDGTLLIVSTEDRQILRYDGDLVDVVADLRGMVPADLGDMAIDAAGHAFIGSQARSGGVIVRLDCDDVARVVAEDLDFPNGMVVMPDQRTLVVAESTGRRLTAFTIGRSGELTDRRPFAEGLAGPPDGIAIDAEGGIWVALTLAHEFQRIVEGADGGVVTDRIDTAGRAAIACALGGLENRTLFLVSSTDAYPERLKGTKLSSIDTVTVNVPGVGSAPAHHHH